MLNQLHRIAGRPSLSGWISAGLAVAVAIAVAPGAIAQTTPWGDTQDRSGPGGGHYWRPPAPPATGLPEGRQQGGASRGSCPGSIDSLVALVPLTAVQTPNSGTAESVWGTTTKAHPSFWFHVPYGADRELPADFVLLDATGDNVLYQTDIAIAATAPSIVSVQLPGSAPELEVGKLYQWYFTIYCDSSTVLFVSGWVQRIALDAGLTAQISAAEPLRQAALYAQNGVWYDALTTLGELRRSRPTDAAIATDWRRLLEAIDLGALEASPIIP